MPEPDDSPPLDQSMFYREGMGIEEAKPPPPEPSPDPIMEDSVPDGEYQRENYRLGRKPPVPVPMPPHDPVPPENPGRAYRIKSYGGAADDTEDKPLLPRYKCHKIVRAAQITTIVNLGVEFGMGCIDSSGNPAYDIYVSHAWIDRHKPQIGGWVVQYDDAYLSYSPDDAFRSGYTRIYT
jgi:hypothetical protein